MAANDAEAGESPKERADRELREALEEIRVALPGIQVLFGFLLILPFSARFHALDGQRYVYVATLLATAISTVLLIAPTPNHRLGFRSIDKERLVKRTNRQVIAGLALIAIAMSLVVQLVVDILLGGVWAGVTAAVVAVSFLGWWFLLPAIDRLRKNTHKASCRQAN